MKLEMKYSFDGMAPKIMGILGATYAWLSNITINTVFETGQKLLMVCITGLLAGLFTAVGKGWAEKFLKRKNEQNDILGTVFHRCFLCTGHGL